jgi:hypothetical protein
MNGRDMLKSQTARQFSQFHNADEDALLAGGVKCKVIAKKSPFHFHSTQIFISKVKAGVGL